jgi:hypothetical protein
MLEQASGAGSAATSAGWGAGLTLVGLTFAVGGISFIIDFKGIATSTVRSTYDARRQVPFVMSRPNTPKRLRQARYALGAGMIFMALLFLAVGVFEFTQL